jgi:hypothetical protein
MARQERQSMSLILWPALITLAITLLRLVGELQKWPTALFNPAAGGGGALVGISWLPFVLGPYFAWTLAKSGKGPKSAWQVAGLGLLGFGVAVAFFAGISRAWPGAPGFLLSFLVWLGAGFIPWRAWPELGRVLLAYALAARVPVALLMLVAIYGNWGTHYDVLPTNPPPALVAMGPLGRWVFIGLVPQLTVWIGITLLIGTIFGAVLVALAKPQPSAA